MESLLVPPGPLRGRRSAHGYDSWLPLVHALVWFTGAESFLELGTGLYSEHLLRLPLRKIDSIEVDASWADHAREVLDPWDRRSVYHAPLPGGETPVVEKLIAKGGEWDLALVDGHSPLRANCLSGLLASGVVGIVLAHDYEQTAWRASYQWGRVRTPKGWACYRWRADFPELGVWVRLVSAGEFEGLFESLLRVGRYETNEVARRWERIR